MADAWQGDLLDMTGQFVDQSLHALFPGEEGVELGLDQREHYSPRVQRVHSPVYGSCLGIPPGSQWETGFTLGSELDAQNLVQLNDIAFESQT